MIRFLFFSPKQEFQGELGWHINFE